MSLAIARAVPFPSFAGGNTSSNAGATQNTRPAQQRPNPPTDTVTLTEAQQVYQLYNQGQRVSQIASSLRLTVDAVNNYLGIAKTASSVR